MSSEGEQTRRDGDRRDLNSNSQPQLQLQGALGNWGWFGLGFWIGVLGFGIWDLPNPMVLNAVASRLIAMHGRDESSRQRGAVPEQMTAHFEFVAKLDVFLLHAVS